MTRRAQRHAYDTQLVAPARQRRVLQRLEHVLPVDDLVGWLISELHGAHRDEVFSVLKAVYSAGFEVGPASKTPRRYHIGRHAFLACPQRVTAKRGADDHA